MAAPFASTAAAGGVRKVLSTTTRKGSFPETRRTVKRGSSLHTVPAPTMIASCSERRVWAKRSDSEELIQRELPLAVARRPSSVWA